ncbi:MAG: hypothetical protein OH316_01330 [Candidatus Parvarchaeota archaeon]|nr:hypothetical protein [Candidatus Parvarchaeota archaeon]
MITYSEFIRILRDESSSRSLTSLTDSRIVDMIEYMSLTKRSLEEAKKIKDEERVSDLSKQIENVISTVNKIIDIRLKKIYQLSLLKSVDQGTKDMMSSKEIVMLDKLTQMLAEYKAAFISQIKEAEPAKEEPKPVQAEKEDGDKMVIKIMSDIPQFIWRNNKTYGPFSFPNVVEVEKDVADILIRSGKAVPA